ncbi:MAG: ABC transporter permease subunit [Alphaproteobacteria bacterium]|nr:ABC transporter permease subunit [Alphaproteobacteria bacterium]
MKQSRFPLSLLMFGYAFLYAPIALLVLYSFNDSRLVAVWSGLSLRWYGELFKDERFLEAAWLSFQVAAISATLALLLGTLAALSFDRNRRFWGRSMFGFLLNVPLVLPDVVIGLALLLAFVEAGKAIGWPAERGMSTIVIAHATIATSYVVVVVRARLSDLDRSLEEAALDLGARPFAVFTSVTLPLLTPALLAGWLLAFTLSLDDVVVAQFVTGPGATTLPMEIFSSMRLGVSPKINALGTLLAAAAAAAVWIAWRLQCRRR